MRILNPYPPLISSRPDSAFHLLLVFDWEPLAILIEEISSATGFSLRIAGCVALINVQAWDLLIHCLILASRV